MKKIKLYDYQQEMLENIIKILTANATGRFYNEKGKKERIGSSVMVQMPTGTGKTYVMAAVVRWFLDNYDEGEVWIIAHRRELVGMFAGLRAGKGIIPTYVKKVKDVIAVNDEMITVKKANTARKKMTAKQLKEYLKNVEPFEQNGRWGLRVKDDIIVKPIYTHISNFQGDYAKCMIGRQRFLYGLLDRRGNVIIPPEYKGLYMWNEHKVEVRGNNGYSKIIEL